MATKDVEPVFLQLSNGSSTLSVNQLPELLEKMNITHDNPNVLVSKVTNGVGDKFNIAEAVAICGLAQSGIVPVEEKEYKDTEKDFLRSRTYLEHGVVTQDEVVLQFMKALEEHKKKCEREGQYLEARSTAQRLEVLKAQEAERIMREMDIRQKSEWDEAEAAFSVEKKQHNSLWDDRIEHYEQTFSEQVVRLQKQHGEQVDRFEADMDKKRPQKPQYSKELLNHRKIQVCLAKQGEYTRAQKIKNVADKMEQVEMTETCATFDSEVISKKNQLRAKQTQEMDALLQRGARGRDQLDMSRAQDITRRQQRFKNIKNELKNLQKLEIVHLEKFLDQQAVAGKRKALNPSPNSTLNKSPDRSNSFNHLALMH